MRLLKEDGNYFHKICLCRTLWAMNPIKGYFFSQGASICCFQKECSKLRCPPSIRRCSSALSLKQSLYQSSTFPDVNRLNMCLSMFQLFHSEYFRAIYIYTVFFYTLKLKTTQMSTIVECRHKLWYIKCS